MTSWSPFLTKILRRRGVKHTQQVNLRFIEDSLITQMQPFFNTEITDIDIEGLQDPVTVVFYTNKGGSKN
jgi:hypothetical protein